MYFERLFDGYWDKLLKTNKNIFNKLLIAKIKYQFQKHGFESLERN